MIFSQRFKASLLVLTGAASYGILSTCVKLAYKDGFSPAEVTGGQVLFGFVALWLLSIRCWGYMKKMPRMVFLKLLGSGVFTGLTGVFYYYALQTLSASFAVLLLFQFTWMGLLADWLLQKKAPNRFQLIGVVIVLAGTLFASGFLEGSVPQLSWTGIGLGLLAAASYTLTVYFSGRVATDVPAILRSSWMLTGAVIVVSFIYPPTFLWSGALTNGLWGWAVILSLFGMILPPYLYTKGAPHLSTGVASIIGAIELPVVIVCSSLLLHERTGLLQWLGIGLIFAGIVVSEWRSKRASQRERNLAEPQTDRPR
ncbi:EamA family transporter [Paenibacillus tyrfis]|uniref:EamA family transporter n=1 Tax=Paenibacillus tyrfis TaxID=1501230 RepID=UPI000B5895EC|nr:DMT family transporter [Paenibacillus tyrfis]